MTQARHEPNGKATIGLYVQIGIFLITLVAPLFLMSQKINSIEVKFSEKVNEIETQFRAADEFRNINLAGQMRFNSLLWQKSYGESFPSEVYFPTIARQR